MGVSEGNFPSEAEKRQFFKLNLQNLVHISFANILLKIHYSFSNEIFLTIMSISPTFPFFFYDVGYYCVVSCFNALAELL